MFVYDADPGRYCTQAYFNGTASGKTNPMPPDPRESGHTGRLEGVRELHATWSFGHSTCNFVQRLYIQYVKSITIHINITWFNKSCI